MTIRKYGIFVGLTILLLSGRIGVSQTYVTIPDPNFVAWLQANLSGAMSGSQLNTSSALVTTRTSLDVSSQNITDLTGVQYFTSLQNLNCLGNNLTTLPTLSNSVDTINCSSNSITSLPTLPAGLVFLNCSNNSIPSLPVLPNSLIYLSCWNIQVATLPTLPPNLNTLVCNYNLLTTLPVLPSTLKNLYCDHNSITCFAPFSNNITSINIHYNSFNCLPNYISAMDAATMAYPICAAGNSNGCPVGISVYQEIGSIDIFPNPSSGSFKITMPQSCLRLRIIDMVGKTIFMKELEGSSTQVDLGPTEKGVYSILVETFQGVVVSKIVIW